MRVVLLLILVLLAACQRPVHPMAGTPQFQTALNQCEWEVQKATASNSDAADRMWAQLRLREMCMRMKGF